MRAFQITLAQPWKEDMEQDSNMPYINLVSIADNLAAAVAQVASRITPEHTSIEVRDLGEVVEA